MTKSEYMKFHAECAAKLVEITKRKNADYTGVSDDPFANFRSHGALGFHVRMHDKMARIKSFIDKGMYEVKDESFLDTCLDLANYAILLAGFMEATRTIKIDPELTKVSMAYSDEAQREKCSHPQVIRGSDKFEYGKCLVCGRDVPPQLGKST